MQFTTSFAVIATMLAAVSAAPPPTYYGVGTPDHLPEARDAAPPPTYYARDAAPPPTYYARDAAPEAAPPPTYYGVGTPDHLPQARAADTDGNIFVCTDANYGGNCENIGFNSGACNNFPTAFQDDISSIGPDDGWKCNVYMYVCNYVVITSPF